MAAGQLSWLEEIFTLNTVLLLDNMEPQLDFIIKPNSLMTVPLLIVASLGGVYFAGQPSEEHPLEEFASGAYLVELTL